MSEDGGCNTVLGNVFVNGNNDGNYKMNINDDDIKSPVRTFHYSPFERHKNMVTTQHCSPQVC